MIDKIFTVTLNGQQYSATVEEENGNKVAKLRDSALVSAIRGAQTQPITLSTLVKSDTNTTLTPDTYNTGDTVYKGYLNGFFPNTGGTLETKKLEPTPWGLQPTITSIFASANNANVATHAEIHLSYFSPEYLGRTVTISGAGITETAPVIPTPDGKGIYIETSQSFGQWLYDQCAQPAVELNLAFTGVSPYPDPYVYVEAGNATVIYNDYDGTGSTSIPKSVIQSIAVHGNDTTITLKTGSLDSPHELVISNVQVNGTSAEIDEIVVPLQNDVSAVITNSKLAAVLTSSVDRYLTVFEWAIRKATTHTFDFITDHDEVTWSYESDRTTDNFNISNIGTTAKWEGVSELSHQMLQTFVPLAYPGKMLSQVKYDAPFQTEGWYNNAGYLSALFEGGKPGDFFEVEMGVLVDGKWVIGKGSGNWAKYATINCGNTVFANLFIPDGNKRITTYLVVKVNGEFITLDNSYSDYLISAKGSVVDETMVFNLNRTAIPHIGKEITFKVLSSEVFKDYVGTIESSEANVFIDTTKVVSKDGDKLSSHIHKCAKDLKSFRFNVEAVGDTKVTNSLFALGNKEGNTITVEDQNGDSILLAPLDKSSKGHVTKITSKIGTDNVTIFVGETKTLDKRK